MLDNDEAGNARFKIMERKLDYGIMTPCGLLTVALGLWIVRLNPAAYMKAGWFHAKLLLVVLLWGYHLYCGHLRKCFARDQNTHGHVLYRWFNEVALFFLITIVILAVVKPF